MGRWFSALLSFAPAAKRFLTIDSEHKTVFKPSWRFTERVMLDRWCALVARVTVTPGHDAARAVFFEYAWVTESAFRAGRSKVLQSFLDRTRIYATDYFSAAFESAARQNLKRSLANLSG